MRSKGYTGRLFSSVLAAVTAVTLSVGTAAQAESDVQAAFKAYEQGDYTTALTEFRRLADGGDVHAQYQLALIYETGRGDFPSEAEAVRWFRLAATNGHAHAQFNLGVRHDKGRGVPRQHKEAVRWYRLAAEQGHTDAQLNLGVKHARGLGVPQNYREAAEWFQKAANQGDARAQYNLGLLYENGWGVPPNSIRAFMWYELSTQRGYAKARTRRNDLVTQMTALHIAEAQRLVRQWRDRGPTTDIGTCCPCQVLSHARRDG